MSFLGSVTFAAYALPLVRLQARELQALWKVYMQPCDLLKQVTSTRGASQFAVLVEPGAVQHWEWGMGGGGEQSGLCDRHPDPAVGVSVPVCLPSPDVGTHSGEQATGVIGQDPAGRSLLERRSLADNAVGTSGRHAMPSPQPAGPPDQHIDGVSDKEPGQSLSCSVAALWQATGLVLPPSDFSTLQHSWRKGTRCQYQSAWRMWCKWCTDQRVDSAST